MFDRTQLGDVPFGRYRLVERLGAGGMAVIFRAYMEGPEGFSRSLVIKRVLPELSRNPKFANMLVAEARVNALLHHPGIVQILDFGEVDGEYYLAMEHVDGWDLSTLLNHAARVGKRPPASVCVHLALELASALAYVHALADASGQPLGIIHRDVSQSNIMVTKLGDAKLLDFGIAKAAHSLRDERTKTGTLKGKLGYMSPEQIEGEAIDRRADIFALGVVLHECLTMRRLFRGDNDLHTIRLVRACAVAPPSTVGAQCDAEIDRVVCKMLARARHERFASCEEVVAALTPIVRRLDGDAAATREFLGTLGEIRPKSQPMTPRSGEDSDRDGARSEVTPSLPADVEATVAEPPRRRDRRPLVLVGAALLGLAIAGAVVLGVRGRAHVPPATSVVPAPSEEAPSPPAEPSPPVVTPPAAPPRKASAPARKPPPKKPRKRDAAPSDLFDPYHR